MHTIGPATQDARTVGGRMGSGRLAGRTVVVTGAARGQGAAEVELLAREGAAVVATDILDADGEKEAARLRAEGLAVHYRHLDVTSETEWRELAGWLTDRQPGVAGLVSNAGIPVR